MPRALLSNKRQLELKERYDREDPVKDIALHFGISTASVSYYAKKHGCKMRKEHR